MTVNSSNSWVARYRQYAGKAEAPTEPILRQSSKESQHAEAEARYGQFLLFLLGQEGQELQTHRVSRYIMDRFGYTPEQWNGLRIRMEATDGIIACEKETAGLIGRVAVNLDVLRRQLDTLPYVTEEIREEFIAIDAAATTEHTES